MSIQIDIIATNDPKISGVIASGSIQEIIPDSEISTFKISSSNLESAVEKYLGQAPTDTYIKSPTPWNDLYNTYGWPQVKRVLVPVKTEVLSLNSIPIIVKTQKFTNNTEKKIPTFNVSISESLSNSISSKWSTGGSFKVGQKFTYGVSFGVEGKGETSIEYTQNWGIEGTKTKTFTIGSTSGVSVPLEPGESVISVLKASRGVMKVRIHYQAYLVGCAAINFKKKYQGHHFWGVDIQSIMQSAGITNAINTTEDIELEYYSDSEIIVKDANNEVTLTSLKFSDLEANMASPVID